MNIIFKISKCKVIEIKNTKLDHGFSKRSDTINVKWTIITKKSINKTLNVLK